MGNLRRGVSRPSKLVAMLGLRFVVIGMAIALAGCNTMRPVAAEDDPAKPAFYTDKVKPILAANCAQCHLGTAHKGGLNMGTKAGMLKGGRDGVVLIPGDPSKSLLVTLMRHEGPTDDAMPMPPSPRPKVSDADIATVARWVKAGAVFPADQ